MQSVCQSGVLLQAQPLAADGLGQTAGQDDLPELILRKTASISSGQRVEQGFAPLGKGRFHHGKNSALITCHRRGGVGSEPDHGGGDLWGREEAVRGDFKEQLTLGVVLTEQGE